MDDVVLPLTAGFDRAEEGDWLALVERDLRGADFDRRLVTELPGGIAVQPLATAADLPARPDSLSRPPIVPRPAGGRVVQTLMVGDPAEARREMQEEFAGGVDACLLTGALPTDPDGWRLVLDGIPAGLEIALAVDAPRSAAALLTATAGKRTVHLGLDPLSGRMAGAVDADPRVAGEAAWRTAGDLAERAGAGSTAIGVSAMPLHEAGADEVTELAVLLSCGVWHLRRAEGTGLEPATAAGLLHLRCSLTTDLFLGIAKLRALRRCWARVLAACGADEAPTCIHARGSRRALTRRSARLNILRATAMGFAGIVGDADRVILPAWDLRRGTTDGRARRLVRNTVHVLRDEGHLDAVADPAAGSFHLERLGEDLSRAAWDRFRHIEADGGATAVIDDGSLAAAAAAAAAREAREFAERRRVAVGVNDFAPAPGEVDPGAVGSTDAAATGLALPPRPASEPWERLRDRAEAWTRTHGAPAPCLLVAVGDPAGFRVRETWTVNALATAGFAAVRADGDAGPDALAAARRNAGAAVAVVCGDDAAYTERLPALAGTLRAAGFRRVLVAGRPATAAADRRESGIDDFLHRGTDLLAMFGRAWDAQEGEG